MKRFLLLIGLITIIPICGYLAGVYVESDYQKQWSDVVAKEFGDKGLRPCKLFCVSA